MDGMAYSGGIRYRVQHCWVRAEYDGADREVNAQDQAIIASASRLSDGLDVRKEGRTD